MARRCTWQPNPTSSTPEPPVGRSMCRRGSVYTDSQYSLQDPVPCRAAVGSGRQAGACPAASHRRYDASLTSSHARQVRPLGAIWQPPSTAATCSKRPSTSSSLPARDDTPPVCQPRNAGNAGQAAGPCFYSSACRDGRHRTALSGEWLQCLVGYAVALTGLQRAERLVRAARQR